MLASLLLTFREGLEAALIVGIMLGTLAQLGHRDRRRTVWIAVGLATALSLALAIALEIAGAELEGQAEYIFEGLAMLLAVAVLTYMIFWMRYQARHFTQELKHDIQQASRRSGDWALFSVAFLAVFREGIETALFLTAARLASDGLSTIIGGTVGLALAVLVGWAIYVGGKRLNLRRFFDVTSILLIVFAAGLFAHGIHELQEAGWLPVVVDEVWNTQAVLDDHSDGGAVVRTLVGYNDNPTLLEVVGYWVYWVVVGVTLVWWTRRIAVPIAQRAASGAASGA
jgi:high-affinity iron transporter